MSDDADGGTEVRDPKSKTQHIEACLTDAVEYTKTTGFERYEFANNALPEVSLEDISIATHLVGKNLKAPLMISPMTGGVDRALEINRTLARAAERWQIPMGVGSQRVGIEDSARAHTFQIRKEAPTTLLFANIGAVQLVKGWTSDHARRAIEMIDADVLFLHLNPIQEAIQGGDQDFRGLTEKIRVVVKELHKDGKPVFVREVGFGLTEDAVRRLIDTGISGIDCAGAGGTSWAKVEGICAKSERRRVMGNVFGEWGVPTAESILNVRAVSERIPLIATGGLRSGVDVAKAIALGADIGSMARPMLVAADLGDAAIDAFIEQTLTELKICMFGVGAPHLEALKGTPGLVSVTPTRAPALRARR
jgi:isopentenyl-diphosphate delta-isomerase